MLPEPHVFAQVITEETCFDFEANAGVDSDGQRWYTLRPRGKSADHTFTIRTTIEWRRLHIVFEADKFAGDLLADMGDADASGQAVFRAVLADSRKRNARTELQINGQQYESDQDEIWIADWRRFHLSMNIGPLEIGTGDSGFDTAVLCDWSGRFATAIVAILPLEQDSDSFEGNTAGYLEGTPTIIMTSRYERDPRNRAAAISIHGTSCLGCGLEMGKRYGQAAAGYIEIHHTTPVSRLGPDYVIDPVRDLVPLCPNCHAVAHRRDPPFSVGEIRDLLKDA